MAIQPRNPKGLFTLLAFGSGLLAFLVLLLQFGWRWYWAWWTGFSLITGLAYGFDKMQARKEEGARIPEIVLHLLAFGGGVAGAWLGRILFRHKTCHVGFTIALVLATILHFAAWWFMVRK
jgi:uncharacterized membrane protein YsdA (DUF1294 family)